ncbi:MAG: hypothetical protein EOO05_10405 [Chitinophagaceae bacterium]|nr:MAG: hypothetical protein EOO05_10405 [Chitinophagaceae bacterium]
MIQLLFYYPMMVGGPVRASFRNPFVADQSNDKFSATDARSLEGADGKLDRTRPEQLGFDGKVLK